MQRNYQNSEYRKSEFQFSDSPDMEFQKKIRPDSSESNTETEFHLRWGSQISEPKIGIPNQGMDGRPNKFVQNLIIDLY